jgi:hypothetical protein
MSFTFTRQFSQSKRARSTGGDALSPALCSCGLFFTAGVLALSIAILLQLNSSLQHNTDLIALHNGMLLNENDKASQMNNLVATSRELVFNSRQSLNACNGTHAKLKLLADQFMQLSRGQAQHIVQEKRRLLQDTVAKLMAQDYGTDSSAAALVDEQKPFTRDLIVGFMNNQVSDVQAPIGNAALFSFDSTAGYVQNESSLYKAFSDLKLPGPDADLQFSLASMPVTSDASLSDATNFHPLAQLVKGGTATNDRCLEFPSAVRITRTTPVTVFGGFKTIANTTATASTHGAHIDL